MTAEHGVESSPIADQPETANAAQPENTDAEQSATETPGPATETKPASTEREGVTSGAEVAAAEGETVPVDGDSVLAEGEAGPAPAVAGTSRSRLWPAISLLVASALLIGTGVAFEVKQHSIRSQSSARNGALADSAATSEVIGQVSTALNKVLSYQYGNPAVTQQAADQLLTGDASSQYKTLFTALQQKAPGEKLTLMAKVVTAGVTSLHGDTAQLLVFLDQSSTRASDKQSSTSAAQLDVTAVKQAGSWKISELHPL